MSLLTYHAVHGEGSDERALTAFVKWESNIWTGSPCSFPNESFPGGELHPEVGFQVVLISSLFLPADPCCSEAALCNERNPQSCEGGRRQQWVWTTGCALGKRLLRMSLSAERAGEIHSLTIFC